jgi:hypothetical protein
MSCLLYNALLNERQSQYEDEKQLAVNAMDIIYKRARAVVILLDDIEITKTEQDALRAYIPGYENHEPHNDGVLYPHYDDVPPYMITNVLMRNIYLKIMRARWFSRAWCMHEARLGKQHVFLMRCQQQPDSPLTVFRLTGHFMMHFLALGMKAGLERVRAWLALVVVKDMEAGTGKQSSSSFIQVFAETFKEGAGGNPRIMSLEARQFDANLDKLSIAMNTIGVGLAVSRTARDLGKDLPLPTEDECCRWFTTVAVAAWDPSALCTSGHELRTNSVQRSWMRWPLNHDINSIKQHRVGPWDIAADPSPGSGWIGPPIGVFDRAGGLRWATESRLRICIRFCQNCLEMGIIGNTFGTKTLNLPGDTWKDLIPKTLACVMDCGIKWLTSTGASDGDLTFDKIHNIPPVRTSLQKLLNSELEIIQDDSVESTLIWTADEHLEAQSLMDLVIYLIYRGPAVDTELGQSMEFWQPVCMTNEVGSKALTFVRRLPGKEVYCATPIYLYPDSPNFYSNLFRAWTLVKGEPEREQSPDGEWVWKYHLMGKSRILGRITSDDEEYAFATVEHAFATIVPNVRVYGPIDLPV